MALSDHHLIIQRELDDFETRHIYAEGMLNTKIAWQIVTLRNQRGWTQEQLAKAAGMKQERISALEDCNYEGWTASTLKRLARAFDVRLVISFETFEGYLDDFVSMRPESLKREPYAVTPSEGEDAPGHH